jgi:hypothetical protein
MGRLKRRFTIVVALLLLTAGLLPPAQALADPAVTLNPTSGPPGTNLTAHGTGWPEGHQIQVQWDRGHGDRQVVGQVKAEETPACVQVVGVERPPTHPGNGR